MQDLNLVVDDSSNANGLYKLLSDQGLQAGLISASAGLQGINNFIGS